MKTDEIKKQLLNYLHPTLIINICNEKYDSVLIDYCKINELDFNIITQNTNNPIFEEKYEKINYHKFFNLDEFNSLQKNDLILIENDFKMNWEYIAKIIDEIYEKYSPVIVLSNFFNFPLETYSKEKLDILKNNNPDNALLNNLFYLIEVMNNNISFSINFTLDLCFLYLKSDYDNEIFDNIIYLNNIDYYELSFLMMNFEKYREIYKLEKEISNLQEINNKWINRNEKLTKTKINLFDEIDSMTKELEKLNENISKLNNRNITLTKTKQELFDEKNNLINKIENNQKVINENTKIIHDSNAEISNLNEKIQNLNNEINILKKDINQLNNDKTGLNTEIRGLNSKIDDLQNNVEDKQKQLNEKTQLMLNFKNKLELQKISMEYLNKNTYYKIFFSPFQYIFLFIKSGITEFKINYDLLNALKKEDYFDRGFYLKEYSDVANGKICKFFSPELHYVCYGFKEKRKINSQQQNLKNKKQLLNILCKK